MKKTQLTLGIATALVFCLSARGQQSEERQGRNKPPSIDQLFEHMDENEDDLLGKDEVKGPLKEMFEKIDANEDGYLSREELENAPKPKGRRPERN